MQLGFVSAILPELSLSEVLTQAANIGYDCVEVMCWPKGKSTRRYAGVTHIDLATLSEKKVKEIKQLIKETGVTISALGYYPNPLTANKKEAAVYIQHIEQLIKAAPLLGLKNINTFIGRDPSKSIADNWARFLEVWKPLVALAKKHKVKIGIENCPMLFTDDEWPGGKNLAVSPAVWKKMFADLKSNYIGLNYDPSHLVLQQMDYVTPIRNFSKRLFHVHAKDLKIDRHRLNEVGIFATPAQWHTPKLPGLGDIHWGHFFSTLTDVGYAGPVCVEVEDRAYEGSLENRLRSLQQSHTYLRQYIPQIRPFV